MSRTNSIFFGKIFIFFFILVKGEDCFAGLAMTRGLGLLSAPSAAVPGDDARGRGLSPLGHVFDA